MSIKYLKSAKIKGQAVLVRIDVNEPLEKRGHLADDFRLRAVIPTIQYLQKQQCKIVLCGHLGRPPGKWDQQYSLKPIAERLAELLQLKFVHTNSSLPTYPVPHFVLFTGNITKKDARQTVQNASSRDIILLENLRFYPDEEANAMPFAKTLASLAQAYVNDGFAVSHRKAASVVAVTKYLPAYGGLLLETELRNLNRLLAQPRQPFVVMMGGIKITDKAKTLTHLGQRAGTILLGGGLANLLLQANGLDIGSSKVEDSGQAVARQLLRNLKTKIVLPKDVVVANKTMAKSSIRVTATYDVRPSEVIFDIGPQTILEYSRLLKQAKTIVWNGPLGYFEHKPFHTSTMALARVIGGRSRGQAFTVVGGGETVDAIRLAGQEQHIDHVSTGGGAMLEYLAGDTLPGLAALDG